MAKQSYKSVEIRFDLPEVIDADAIGHICYQVTEGIRRAAECQRYKQFIHMPQETPENDRTRPRIGLLRIVRSHGSPGHPMMDKSKNVFG